jgi:hypothetical protein
VAGKTDSDNFPGTSSRSRTDDDAFVVRLNSTLTQIIQSTYLGGSGADGAYALAIHPQTGDVYVAGITTSKDFPKTKGGAQISYGGLRDAFVARLNSGLTQIIQSTYLGGSLDDGARALAIHPTTGDIYVAGWTESFNFPETTDGAQVVNHVVTDAFVARLSADLAAGRKFSDGRGHYTAGSVSSLASTWNILLLLSVPAFALAKRIRKR